MQLAYKPDWDVAAERMRAWWAHEPLDRPIIQVTAPRAETPNRPGWSSWELIHHLDRPEAVLDRYEIYCQRTFFGGEAFPNFWVNLGPGIPAAYFGRTPQIAEATVWFEADEPMSWEAILDAKLEPDQKWWRLTKDLTALATERGKHTFLASVTDLNGVHNILGSLRGTQQLLVDCLDAPEMVKRASHHITDIWLQCFDTLIGITRRHQEGSSSWMGIWFPGIGSDVQSDFSAMVSPDMFAELILPDLRRQCQHVEQSVFHWDGPGQIPHLDHLLSIPELDGIQWVPGDGNPDVGAACWFPLYRRILAADKLLVLQGIKPEDIQGVVQATGDKGVLFTTHCDSEAEARALLVAATKWP